MASKASKIDMRPLFYTTALESYVLSDSTFPCVSSLCSIHVVRELRRLLNRVRIRIEESRKCYGKISRSTAPIGRPTIGV